MSISSLWISSFLIGVSFITLTMGRSHHHCDHLEIIKNFQRMCKSYAMWKRSTANYYQGDFDNDVGQWQPITPEGSGSAYEQHGGRMTGQPPWWWYSAAQSQSRKDEPEQRSRSQFYGGAENLDPIYFEGEEGLETLERWRRNKEVEAQLEKFIRYCCTYGCPFPSAYLEVEKVTNICSLR